MDFDLKVFFKDSPPRFKEEVKVHMHDLAAHIVRRIALHFRLFGIERVLPRHVRLVMFNIAQDPFTRYCRSELSVEHSKVKSMLKLFQRVLDEVDTAMETDPRYGNIDKKIVKGTLAVLQSENVRTSQGGAVCIAACVAEVCGIMLNCTQKRMEDQKTISLGMLKSMSIVHRVSTGEECINASLIRLLHSVTYKHQARVCMEKRRRVENVPIGILSMNPRWSDHKNVTFTAISSSTSSEAANAPKGRHDERDERSSSAKRPRG